MPKISVAIEEFSRDAYNKIAGMGQAICVNEELYQDHVVQKAKKVSAAAAAAAAGAAPAPGAEKDDGEKGGSKAKRQAMYYKVTVADNGMGMQHEDVPNMFGRGACAAVCLSVCDRRTDVGAVLAGTKYGVRQARGKFGLGAKMVCYLL